MENIDRQYHATLQDTRIRPDTFPTSPGNPINGEDGFEHRFAELIEPRIRRSLRAAHLNGVGGTPLTYGHGSLAKKIKGGKPDIAYVNSRMPARETRCNHAPGDLKLAWKWPMADWDGDPARKKDFKQVLAQVNFYMKEHDTQYGYILTDAEFVAIKRIDQNGRLKVSESVRWNANANDPHGLTLLHALWYLGVLAARDTGGGR